MAFLKSHMYEMCNIAVNTLLCDRTAKKRERRTVQTSRITSQDVHLSTPTLKLSNRTLCTKSHTHLSDTVPSTRPTQKFGGKPLLSAHPSETERNQPPHEREYHKTPKINNEQDDENNASGDGGAGAEKPFPCAWP